MPVRYSHVFGRDEIRARDRILRVTREVWSLMVWSLVQPPCRMYLQIYILIASLVSELHLSPPELKHRSSQEWSRLKAPGHMQTIGYLRCAKCVNMLRKNNFFESFASKIAIYACGQACGMACGTACRTGDAEVNMLPVTCTQSLCFLKQVSASLLYFKQLLIWIFHIYTRNRLVTRLRLCLEKRTLALGDFVSAWLSIL